MKCVLSNSCTDKALCCSFCEKKSCADRCKDNHEGCRFFVNEEYERKEKKPHETGGGKRFSFLFRKKRGEENAPK